MTHADNGSYPLKTLWFLALIFSMLSVGIIVIGYIYYQNHVSLFLTEKEGELKTIADMKVDQISMWRAERVHDAQQVSDDPLLAMKFLIGSMASKRDMRRRKSLPICKA